jgi:DNA-directed RNA polymerase subunit RPC12/RpoP
MNFNSFFAEEDSPSEQKLMQLFAVAAVVIALGTWRILATRSTPQLKKLWSDRISLAVGIGFFFLLCAMWIFAPAPPSGKNYFPLLIIAPAFAFFTWLSIRNTYYCGKCGHHSFNPKFYGNKTYHCPKCGDKLR